MAQSPVVAVALKPPISPEPISTFSLSEQPVSPTKGHGLDHIGFEVKGLEAFTKKLEAQGVKFNIPYRKLPSGLAIAFFTDPWGSYVELTEGLDKI